MIFISHTEVDKPLVEPIAQQLATVYGQENIFYDSWSVQPGEGIIGKMNDALTNCKFFFFFVSRHSLQSKMVELEWQTAIFMATKGQVNFIAVKIDDCIIPSILSQKKYINLSNDGLDVAVRKMKDVIEGRNVSGKGKFYPFIILRHMLLTSLKDLELNLEQNLIVSLSQNL